MQCVMSRPAAAAWLCGFCTPRSALQRKHSCVILSTAVHNCNAIARGVVLNLTINMSNCTCLFLFYMSATRLADSLT